MPLRHHKTTVLAGLALFVTTYLIFLFSPVHQVADSNYSMLLSQSLLQHRTFALDNYDLPRLPPKQYEWYFADGNIYQLELFEGHIYYVYPPGTSILSTPYVGMMHLFGIGVANPDRTYSMAREERMEISLAALLMAGYAVVVFLTARLRLPTAWSLVIAFGTALGTQVWSGASRAMWTDTWGVFLLGASLLLLVGVETGRWKLRPVLLATLLCWLYFVRPTYAIAGLPMALYVLLYYRAKWLPFVATGVVWLAGFVAYSEYHFHKIRPSYYNIKLNFSDFWQALPGNLISPSRGLLVYVPVLIFVVYLLIRYRAQIALPRLALLGSTVVTLHILAISGFSPWYGGHCYGSRYTTGLVPWFALLALLAVEAKRRASAGQTDKKHLRRTRAEWTVGALLLGASLFTNGRGALSFGTTQWNAIPVNVDTDPSRVWDWRDPQFLRTER